MCLPKKMTTDIASLVTKCNSMSTSTLTFTLMNDLELDFDSDLDFQSHQVEILVSFTFETNHESEFLLTWLWI